LTVIDGGRDRPRLCRAEARAMAIALARRDHQAMMAAMQTDSRESA